MSSAKTVAQTLVVLLFVAACSLAPTTIAAPATNPLSKTTNGLEVQLVSAYRDGDDVWVTLCYEQPSGTNWVPGRHADDLFLTVHGTTYNMSSMELIGFRPFLDNQAVHRCDRFHFDVPETPPDGICQLTLAHLAGDTASAHDCPEVQQRLDAEQTGITIECLTDSAGYFSYGLLERPDTMTDLEASYVVDDLAGDVMAGPWQFEFSIVSAGD